MRKLLPIICFVLAAAFVLFAGADGAVAVMLTLAVALLILFVIRVWFPEYAGPLTDLFLIALIARLVFGLIVHIADARDSFGGDAQTYDFFGWALMRREFGYDLSSELARHLENRNNSVGWGMYYLVAALYAVIGRNILAAQSFVATIGAATAPVIFLCSRRIFSNDRTALIAGYAVALFPALVVWSGQLLKDGLVIFFLVVSMTIGMKLRERMNVRLLILLGISLFGIFALRSYIFYMACVAIVGMFVVPIGGSNKAIVARIFVLSILGLAATYLIDVPVAETDLGRFTDLERIQVSREDLSRAGSGFGEDIDVSTTQGAIQALPVGFTFLMLAPFPWQITSMRAAAALPDMLIWWLSLPFLVAGLIYSVKHRLSESLGLLVFSGMLTLAYSVFQGNVGTAYRQRTQIQVFLFIFTAVGVALQLEKRENRKLIRQARRREIEQNYRERERLRVEGGVGAVDN
ncbi:MAG TPA: phospholipid carrier-dependent glycosyltransferase [Aridibacter sp.]|nr:phospholipid carrier-dependent glycosyltransferase [Aridibacter sp.]